MIEADLDGDGVMSFPEFVILIAASVSEIGKVL